MKLVSKTALACVTAIAVSFCVAQQKVAPPPRPTDSSPTQAETLAFIKAHMEEIGTVQYSTGGITDVDGNEHPMSQTVTISDIQTEAEKCRITYRMKLAKGGYYGGAASERTYWIPLKEVKSISVMPLSAAKAALNSQSKPPSTTSVTVDPDMPTLVAMRRNHRMNIIPFQDAEVADRVARAMVHAVEMCGGGQKPEPF